MNESLKNSKEWTDGWMRLADWSKQLYSRAYLEHATYRKRFSSWWEERDEAFSAWSVLLPGCVAGVPVCA